MQNECSVFVCYSHEDDQWVTPGPRGIIPWLQRCLRPDGVEFWWDNETDIGVRFGDEWRGKIFSAIKRADLAVLLISNNFAASDFIRDEELPRIKARCESEGIGVLPVLVSPLSEHFRKRLSWPLGLQVFPHDQKSLIGYVQKDSEWDEQKSKLLDAVSNCTAQVRLKEQIKREQQAQREEQARRAEQERQKRDAETEFKRANEARLKADAEDRGKKEAEEALLEHERKKVADESQRERLEEVRRLAVIHAEEQRQREAAAHATVERQRLQAEQAERARIALAEVAPVSAPLFSGSGLVKKEGEDARLALSETQSNSKTDQKPDSRIMKIVYGTVYIALKLIFNLIMFCIGIYILGLLFKLILWLYTIVAPMFG